MLLLYVIGVVINVPVAYWYFKLVRPVRVWSGEDTFIFLVVVLASWLGMTALAIVAGVSLVVEKTTKILNS